MAEQVIWMRAKLYGDGGGRSRQEHYVLLGPSPLPDGTCADETALIETGIIYHWCSYSSPPKGETEDAYKDANCGPSNLEGIEEQSWEYAGKHYATVEQALAARSDKLANDGAVS